MGASKLASIFFKNMDKEPKIEVKVTFKVDGRQLRAMVHFYLNEYGGSVLHGRYIEWGSRYPFFKRDATYKHGKLDGSAIDYDSEGRKSEEGIWDKGVLVGNLKYNEAGEIVSQYGKHD